MHRKQQSADILPVASQPDQRPSWHRVLAMVSAGVFLVSAVFPAAAGLIYNTAALPQWWGVVDVTLAFILGLLAFALISLSQGKVSKAADAATYKTYRVLIHGVLLLLVIFFLAGDRVTWSNCITGFAWRSWLLLYTLPAWFTAMKGSSGAHPLEKTDIASSNR